ncbi:Phenylacetate-coenzyme A ligase [Desulfovibrio sp. DV]|uniref:DVU_1553 family AMP-dependent CoA ligase n=1 Tax=Desulfovibrio sp. DV TaxID=1844708 RepID=UPI00094BAB0D|nr:AMP-binding protein [Desulfovibrio sp. DV]OLN25533.1 Phenylacetate-coenzyme A ligase [Desulfovibrio sp. DV]
MRVSPFDAWIAAATGQGGQIPDPARLADWQLAALGRSLDHARSAPFYRDRLARLPDGFPDSLAAFATLPTTTPEELAAAFPRFLAVAQDAIARMVTVATSGTTGPPKRMGLTDADIEETLDCFRVVMAVTLEPGETVLILFPAEKPDSVGDLIGRGMRRLGANPVFGDPTGNPARLAEALLAHRPKSLIAAPSQLTAALDDVAAMAAARTCLRSVVYASDFLSPELREKTAARFGCRVFDYYSATEMAYGGGMECAAGDGYHLREAQLYFEVLDPGSDTPVAAGEVGEVVFTTLTRRGVPLVRYRTGDAARMLPGPCPCGSALRRLGPILGRIKRTEAGWMVGNPDKGRGTP